MRSLCDCCVSFERVFQQPFERFVFGVGQSFQPLLKGNHWEPASYYLESTGLLLILALARDMIVGWAGKVARARREPLPRAGRRATDAFFRGHLAAVLVMAMAVH